MRTCTKCHTKKNDVCFPKGRYQCLDCMETAQCRTYNRPRGFPALPVEKQQLAIRMYAEGEKVSVIAKAIGMDSNVLRYWVRIGALEPNDNFLEYAKKHMPAKEYAIIEGAKDLPIAADQKALAKFIQQQANAVAQVAAEAVAV